MARPHVLIVEDEQDIAGLIKHALERGGDADAEIVGSGDAALKAAAERVPDLIILDLNLPVLSGLDVCRLLRSRDRTRTGRRRLRHQAVQPPRAVGSRPRRPPAQHAGLWHRGLAPRDVSRRASL